MENLKTENAFKILSYLMDETVSENSALEILNDLRLTVDEKLIPAIEKVQYKSKYDLIDRICDICRDISLYLNFPEMIDRIIVGFHFPDTFSLCDCSISDAIPTIIHGNPDYQTIRGLNLSEKTVSLSDKEYSELLIHSKMKEIDLAGVLYDISIPSKNMDADQVYVVIPRGIDVSKKYYKSTVNLVDTLVIHAKECLEEVLKEYGNISSICVYGRIPEKNKYWISKYCKENDISIEYFNSLEEIINNLKCNVFMVKNNNFCYIYYLENILYEISWYLSSVKLEAEKPLSDINDNLLYKNEKSYQCIKDLQKRYSAKINFIEKLYADYKNICDELIEKMVFLQKSFGVRESIDCINQHIKMEEILLELVLKLSETYHGFSDPNGREKMRIYCAIYKKLSGNIQVSNVILNDFLGTTQSQDDLAVFKNMQSDSIFFKRKKIDLREKLHLATYDCANIILELDAPLRCVEKRILGEYSLKQGKKELAKEYLKEAMKKGDKRAGELLVQKMTISESELEQIADYGVKIAAYKLGKDLYSKGDILNSTKYLNIAASQGHLEAIKLLGDINYEKYIENLNAQVANQALYYYLIAEKKGTTDSKIYEKIGELCFEQGNYAKAREYCQKVDTAKSNYLLGVISEKGYGCAVDKNSALKYYSKAKQGGHYGAETAYSRLNAEIEARKKRTMVNENKSYGSSSYTSNYSSSSGW